MNVALDPSRHMAPPAPELAAAGAILLRCFPERRIDRVLFVTPPDGEADLQPDMPGRIEPFAPSRRVA